jgi:protein-S-isoprenylcysteine O-methyltransferase Ste14
MVSGVVLALVVVFWQASGSVLFELQGPPRWLMRIIFFFALLGMAWGGSALKCLDPFGRKPIRDFLKDRRPRPSRFHVYGPYRWVRHPLYFFVLLLIWSVPDLTSDRLFHNFLWSAWIIIGAVLEERDLVAEFGKTYQTYQQTVPMIIPRKPRRGSN